MEKCSLNPYQALSCWEETYCHLHLCLEAPDGSLTWWILYQDKHLSHTASLVSINVLCDEAALGCSCYKAASKEVLFLFPDMSDLIKYMWPHFSLVGAHSEHTLHEKEPEGAARWVREKEETSRAFVKNTAGVPRGGGGHPSCKKWRLWSYDENFYLYLSDLCVCLCVYVLWIWSSTVDFQF